MNNKDQLARLEERIEQLVEGSFARLFGNRLQPRELAVKLARAVEDNAQTAPPEIPGASRYAPNEYRVALNPEDLDAILAEHADLSALLAETVVDLAHRAGLRLDNLPLVRFEPDSNVALHDVQISANYNGDELRSTQVLRTLTEPPDGEPSQPSRPRNPQLILHGQTIIPLERTVTNLGRKHDNHVVIDDPRVSRAHAQIRLRFGRYVLYDLGSRGGTYVNNHRITEYILRPGDVISLSGMTLVYVEDETTSGTVLSDTQLRPPDQRKRSHDNDPTL